MSAVDDVSIREIVRDRVNQIDRQSNRILFILRSKDDWAIGREFASD